MCHIFPKRAKRTVHIELYLSVCWHFHRKKKIVYHYDFWLCFSSIEIPTLTKLLWTPLTFPILLSFSLSLSLFFFGPVLNFYPQALKQLFTDVSQRQLFSTYLNIEGNTHAPSSHLISSEKLIVLNYSVPVVRVPPCFCNSNLDHSFLVAPWLPTSCLFPLLHALL